VGRPDIEKNQHRPELLPPYTPEQIIGGDFTGKHIISVDQFEKNGSRSLNALFETARRMKERVRASDPSLPNIASGRVMASLFFESSTRTDMSFQAAMKRLGGDVVAASNGIQFSSVYKGENLQDTIRAAGCYADIVVLRHPEVGSSYVAAEYLDRLSNKLPDKRTTVISGGDGIGEHPTQAMLDIFTIIDKKGSIDDLRITMVGDLKHGRTVHSLAKLIAYYGAHRVSLNLVSPHTLQMPESIATLVERNGVSVTRTNNITDVLRESDVIYWTRVQEERFENPKDYEAIKNDFIITPDTMEFAHQDAILMHPLPRKQEMGTKADHDILDDDPRAVYFEQMENGMFVRMALLSMVMQQNL